MTWALRAAIAISSILSGYLHYDIWANHGYKGAPVKELFVIQAGLAVVLGLVALVPIRWASLPAAAVALASLVAFALSRTTGVPTFNGTFTESGLQPSGARFVGVSSTLVILVAEVLVVVLAAVLVLDRRRDTA